MGVARRCPDEGRQDTRDVIMDPTATSLGFAWYQEPSGKIWWTLISGT